MEGRQSMVEITKAIPPPGPIAQVQTKLKELELGFKTWLSKQSLPVEAAIVTVTSAAQGAAIGAFMGTLTADATSSLPTAPQAGLNPQAMASLKQAQALTGGPLVQARNFAVMTGVNAGISCVMKRIRGVEDLGQKFSQPPVEDVYYTRTRNMLTNLGLQNYESNFKKGLLTDRTLPLLNDNALRDVKIPPGPRLLILDHIQRDPELVKERR
ncbi:hypothetical protein AMTRI_Chr06g191100 [Amborella trichopoda]